MEQMMVRHSSIRPVNSIKHVIDNQLGLTGGTKTDVILVNAQDSPQYESTTFDVEVGAVVNSIFLNVQVAASAVGSIANVYMYVIKNPGNNLTTVNGNVVGTSDIRKFVIHQEMIMTEEATNAISRTLFKGVIKLPRSYRRFGVKDRLTLSLFSPGVNFVACVQCIYKEFK